MKVTWPLWLGPLIFYATVLLKWRKSNTKWITQWHRHTSMWLSSPGVLLYPKLDSRLLAGCLPGVSMVKSQTGPESTLSESSKHVMKRHDFSWLVRLSEELKIFPSAVTRECPVSFCLPWEQCIKGSCFKFSVVLNPMGITNHCWCVTGLLESCFQAESLGKGLSFQSQDARNLQLAKWSKVFLRARRASELGSAVSTSLPTPELENSATKHKP